MVIAGISLVSPARGRRGEVDGGAARWRWAATEAGGREAAKLGSVFVRERERMRMKAQNNS